MNSIAQCGLYVHAQYVRCVQYCTIHTVQYVNKIIKYYNDNPVRIQHSTVWMLPCTVQYKRQYKIKVYKNILRYSAKIKQYVVRTNIVPTYIIQYSITVDVSKVLP